jgi:hypothetical protein
VPGSNHAPDAERARDALQHLPKPGLCFRSWGRVRSTTTFFALWKDADPDVPILIQARAEYGALAK